MDDQFEIPETGAVFTFGKSRFTDNKPSHFFIKNDPIVSIACGDEHTVVLCQNGRLFTFGSNEYGQLGLGHTTTVTRPSCIKTLKPYKIKLIACGRSHTIAVTDTNHVYTFGNNSDGQLGHSNTIDKDLPVKITSLPLKNNENITQISAGSRHSAFLTDKGKIFIWGSNAEGQLGLNIDVNTERVPTPTLLPIPDKATFLSCGYYHTAFITDRGVAYTFGENKNGKLGLHLPGPTVLEPQKIEMRSVILTKVFCGGHHTFLITTNNDVYAFGSNIEGQLGVADESVVFIPEPIKLRPNLFESTIVNICCGDKHTAFLTDNGKLYTCGDAKYGKLGQNVDIDRVYTPQLITAFEKYVVTNISCGGNHTIFNVQNENLESLALSKMEIKLEQLQKIPPLPPMPVIVIPKMSSLEITEKTIDISGNSINRNLPVYSNKLSPFKNGDVQINITNGNLPENAAHIVEIFEENVVTDREGNDVTPQKSPLVSNKGIAENLNDPEQQEFELLEKKFEEEELKSDTVESNTTPLPTSPSLSDENEIDPKYYKDSTLTLKTDVNPNHDLSKLSNEDLETSSAEELENDENSLSVDSLEIPDKAPESVSPAVEVKKTENRVTKMFNSFKRKKIFSSDSKLNVSDSKRPSADNTEEIIEAAVVEKTTEKSKTCALL